MTQKRQLFDELMDGVEFMEQQRTGKVTLCTHEIDDLPPLKIDAENRCQSQSFSDSDTVKLPYGIRVERGRL